MAERTETQRATVTRRAVLRAGASLALGVSLCGCGYADALLGAVVDADGGTVDVGSQDASQDASQDSGASTALLLVTNTQDAGPGSLRQALLDAAAAAQSQITFDIPDSDPGHLYYRDNASVGLSPAVPAGGAEDQISDFDADYPAGTARSWWRITLLTPLPPAARVTLDAVSQKTARGITANGPVVELVGDAVSSSPGLELTESSVAGLILGGFEGPGLRLTGAGSTLRSVYSGVDPAGIVAHANRLGAELIDAASGAVGGTADDERCVLAGNLEQQLLISGAGSTGVQVSHTYCGLGADGKSTPAGGTRATVGIEATNGVSGLVLGGPTAVHRVAASGNEVGVLLRSVSDVTLGFTYVGASPPPEAIAHTPIPNSAEGVRMELVSGVAVRNSMINWNGGPGIFVASGDGVVMRNNVILGNAGLGIDLAPLGANPPPTGTAGMGPNQGQNAPVITGLLSGPTRLSVELTSTPSTTFLIDLEYEVFAGTGGEQGILARTETTVVTSPTGFVAFELPTTTPPIASATFMVTATRLEAGLPVLTSERVTLANTP